MKIPKKLKIGGHTYEVRFAKGGKHLSLDASGITNSKGNLVIEINSDECRSEQEATLLHEIMHALNAQWNSNDTLHTLMEATSQQLYQVLSDNKMLK